MASSAVTVASAKAPAVVVPVGAAPGGSSRQSTVLLSAPKAGGMSRKLVCNKSRVVMSAPAQMDHHLAGLTSMALLAAAIVPEIAEAAQPGISPSLTNLLLSVLAGGVVASAIGIAVAGVSTFDPVKRR